MTDKLLSADLPGVLPDNRVLCGQCAYVTPMAELTRGAVFLRGIINGLVPESVAVLRQIAAHPELKQLLLIVALYPGSRTWDDVLLDLLKLQGSKPDRIQFRLLARRSGPDLPANLLWVQPGSSGHGHVITGNVSNLLAAARWDPTDAVLALPLEPTAAEALRKWFDNAHARSRPLTKETAAAPRLRLPEGDAEGERLWREYIDLLDRWDKGVSREVLVDPKTGEVESAVEPTPSEARVFPRPDPVLLAVQTVLAKGSVVAVDEASRAPPLSAPVKAEFFGERADIRSGAARRQQHFSVSLFDEDTARRLGRWKAAMSARLARCSLMLRDGVRWVPDAAHDLLKAEFAAVESEALEALKTATGGKAAADFVQTCLAKIEDDCKTLAKMIAPGRAPPPDLVTSVKSDLEKRLCKNLKQGMVPSVSRSLYQIVLSESEREGPWDQVQTLLASAARLPREIVSDPRRTLGLVTTPEKLVAAFNVFSDPLVARYLDGRRVDVQASRDLELIKTVQDHPTAKPKQRAYALFQLIRGDTHDTVRAALSDENPSE